MGGARAALGTTYAAPGKQVSPKTGKTQKIYRKEPQHDYAFELASTGSLRSHPWGPLLGLLASRSHRKREKTRTYNGKTNTTIMHLNWLRQGRFGVTPGDHFCGSWQAGLTENRKNTENLPEETKTRSCI